MSNVNFNKKPDKEPQSGTCAEVHQAHSVDKDVTKFQAEATRRMKKNPADADMHRDPDHGFNEFQQKSANDDIEKDPIFDEIISWTTDEIRKVSTRLGKVEQVTQLHANKLSDNEDLIQAVGDTTLINSQKIAELDSNIVEVANRVEDIQEQVNSVDKTLTDNFKNASTIMQVKFDDLYERIENEAEHSNAVLTQTRKGVGVLAERIQSIEKSVKQKPAGCGGRPKTLPLHPDEMKKYGVFFNNSNRYHPHRYITAFESYVKSMNLDDGTKCASFCSNIEIDIDWKESQQEITDYDELIKNFLREYWSVDEQEAAYKHFEERIATAPTIRSLARACLKWIRTLRNTPKPEQDIIALVYDKLPEELTREITKDDKVNLDVFYKKIDSFQEIREKPKRKKFVVERNKPKPPVEERKYDKNRFARRDSRHDKGNDRGGKTSGSTYNRNNSSTRTRDYSGQKARDYSRDRGRDQSSDRKVETEKKHDSKYRKDRQKQVNIDLKSDKPSKNFTSSMPAKQLNTEKEYSSDEQYTTAVNRETESDSSSTGNDDD